MLQCRAFHSIDGAAYASPRSPPGAEGGPGESYPAPSGFAGGTGFVPGGRLLPSHPFAKNSGLESTIPSSDSRSSGPTLTVPEGIDANTALVILSEVGRDVLLRPNEFGKHELRVLLPCTGTRRQNRMNL
jgi:hypothetical protein